MKQHPNRLRHLAAWACTAAFLVPHFSSGADRISEDAPGNGGNGPSTATDITPDGKFAVFQSTADNLVGDDTNTDSDVFLYDLDADSLTLVARDSSGNQTAAASTGGTVSNDGRYVCFTATATDLVSGEADDGFADVYVKDLEMGDVTIASFADDESEPDADCVAVSISGNGQFVLFTSAATNLIGTGNDTNTIEDLFVRDLVNNTTVRVSVADNESEITGATFDSPSISDDGNLVAFASSSPDLVTGDTAGFADVFVRNISAGTTERITIDTMDGETDGDSANPVIAGGGFYVAFESAATDLVDGDVNMATDVFIRDIVNDITQIVSITTNRSQVDEASTNPTISANGRFVGFLSSSASFDSRFLGGADEGFVKDLQTSSVEIANVTKNNKRGNGTASVPFVSSNGALAFSSDSSNLITGDSEGQIDAFYQKGGTPKIVVNNALKAAFKKKIKKAKEALKNAKRAGKTARVKSLKRKIKALKKKLKNL